MAIQNAPDKKLTLAQVLSFCIWRFQNLHNYLDLPIRGGELSVLQKVKSWMAKFHSAQSVTQRLLQEGLDFVQFITVKISFRFQGMKMIRAKETTGRWIQIVKKCLTMATFGKFLKSTT